MTEPAIDPKDSERPTTMRFKRNSSAVRMPADEARRQGAVAALAFSALGNRDDALAFLNAHDEALGGRPLDIAIASDDGFAQVRDRLAPG